MRLADQNTMSREEAAKPSNDLLLTYAAAKALAEKEVWKFADQYPDIEFITRES